MEHFLGYHMLEHKTSLNKFKKTDIMTASRGEGYGVKGLSKKQKGLMDMDNSVVIAGGMKV